jgi:hypothetical protein
MNSTGKTVNLCLFLLFTTVFISPLRADPLPDAPQPSPQSVEPEVRGSPLEPQPSPQPSVREHRQGSPLDEPPVNDTSFLNEEDLPGDDYGSVVFEAPPLILEGPGFEIRSFNNVFPGLSRVQRANIISGTGARNSFKKGGSPTLIPNPDSGINLLSGVMAKNPSHIIEALVLVPYNRRELDFLDIYNALRNIKNIQNYTISIRGNDVKIFKDTTRLESAQRRRPVPDPPRADILPHSETMYRRFVDQYMGDLFIRGNISIGLYGITYNLSNFRDVFYSVFRIMRAESFSAIIYLEPVKEGILVYSMSGIYIPNFVANRVNLTPNMNNRITVLVDWITEGLREEEYYSQRNYFYQQ